MIFINQQTSKGVKKKFTILTPEAEYHSQIFTMSGGWYEAQTWANGKVTFTACIEEGDLWVETCSNGPEVPGALESLVRNALDRLQTGVFLVTNSGFASGDSGFAYRSTMNHINFRHPIHHSGDE